LLLLYCNCYRVAAGVGIDNHNINIYVIRYEDLLYDTSATLIKALDFIGISYKFDNVNNAIEKASVDYLREKENLGMWFETEKNNINFIGPAVNNQWISRLSQEQIELIEKFSYNQMKQWGYL